ncbi:MAG: adaptor protein [Bacillus thermozeamaize]|jgi:adapter protein MecA 1/2|uniref:Adaptor protein n=1 Tax=Bacillus thermozeamaize TaxID=230954 RepID=A0A1Y3PQS1_9BACI|nr:MAG: adaptor protein [Bacillus thermozeamaize]
MRVERLGQDKIRIFLTFDDLMERGIEKEDMWRDIPKVHELFNEMMEQAYDEVGFEINGPVAVEVFALPAQGMVVIVTRGHRDQLPEEAEAEQDTLIEEELYEMEVTLEENDWIVYRFRDFENLIAALHHLRKLGYHGGSVYAYQENYYFYAPGDELNEEYLHAMVAILSEYGEASTLTPYVLEEYAKRIAQDTAVVTLTHYFR